MFYITDSKKRQVGYGEGPSSIVSYNIPGNITLPGALKSMVYWLELHIKEKLYAKKVSKMCVKQNQSAISMTWIPKHKVSQMPAHFGLCTCAACMRWSAGISRT